MRTASPTCSHNMDAPQEQHQEEKYSRAGIRTFKATVMGDDGEAKAVQRSFFWNTKTWRFVCRASKAEALKASEEATEQVCVLTLRVESPATVVASRPFSLCPARQSARYLHVWFPSPCAEWAPRTRTLGGAVDEPRRQVV